jgi:hypothetical protein
MNSDDTLAKLKKQRNLMFGMAALTAFMETMKVVGIFSIGVFPVWAGFGLSIALLVYGIVLAIKVQNSEQTPK